MKSVALVSTFQYKSTALLIAFLTSILLLTGCDTETENSDINSDVRTDSSLYTSPDNDTSPETEINSKAEAEMNLQTRLEALEIQANELEARIRAAGDQASQTTLRAWADLETEIEAAQNAMAELQNSTLESWIEFQVEADASLQDLEEAYQNIRIEFENDTSAETDASTGSLGLNINSEFSSTITGFGIIPDDNDMLDIKMKNDTAGGMNASY